MKTDRSPQIALVVVWPQSVPAPVARQAMRRLFESRVRCTWAVDQASQVESLASWGAIRARADAALRAPAIAELSRDGEGRELTRRLDLLRATGLGIDVVLGEAALATGAWPRMLRAMGIHGLVVEGGHPAGVARALPFGVWQFSPLATAPLARGWRSWFRPRRPEFFAVPKAGSTVAAIDLGRVGAPDSRGWREVEATVELAVAAFSRGAAALVTVSELAKKLTQANAPRPQRSILRTAA